MIIMDFWLYRAGLWVILFILEMFVGSLDFLALGIASFVTALLTYVLGIHIQDWHWSGLIFAVSAVLAIMLTRLLVAPRLRGEDAPSPMSGDNIVGKRFQVQEANGRDVIKYEGMYRNIASDADYQVWDTVEVVSMDDNLVRVK